MTRKFVVKLSMKLLTLFGLVMSVLTYSALATTLERSALRSSDRMPMYIHPRWMSREMGEVLGSPEHLLVVPLAITGFMIFFWVSMSMAARAVRREFPREVYTWKA